MCDRPFGFVIEHVVAVCLKQLCLSRDAEFKRNQRNNGENNGERWREDVVVGLEARRGTRALNNANRRKRNKDRAGAAGLLDHVAKLGIDISSRPSVS
jgi:hypothetical protein